MDEGCGLPHLLCIIRGSCRRKNLGAPTAAGVVVVEHGSHWHPGSNLPVTLEMALTNEHPQVCLSAAAARALGQPASTTAAMSTAGSKCANSHR